MAVRSARALGAKSVGSVALAVGKICRKLER
jgi:hypothetical protein